MMMGEGWQFLRLLVVGLGWVVVSAGVLLDAWLVDESGSAIEYPSAAWVPLVVFFLLTFFAYRQKPAQWVGIATATAAVIMGAWWLIDLRNLSSDYVGYGSGLVVGVAGLTLVLVGAALTTIDSYQ